MGLSIGDIIDIGGSVIGAFDALDAGDDNAAALEEQARRERERTKLEVQRQRKVSRRIRGEQAVAFVASGVSGRSGTALDIIGDSMAEAEMDVRLIEAGGSIAENLALSEARLSRQRGQDLFTRNLLGGVSVLAGEIV